VEERHREGRREETERGKEGERQREGRREGERVMRGNEGERRVGKGWMDGGGEVMVRGGRGVCLCGREGRRVKSMRGREKGCVQVRVAQ
jgi:hypothetical protein